MSDAQRPHGLQPSRLLHPWDFPGKSTRAGCHCLLCPSALGKGNSTGKTRSSQEVFSREPLAWAGGIDMAGEELTLTLDAVWMASPGEELALTPDAAWMASPCDRQSIPGLSFSISTLNRLHWMVFSASCEPSEERKALIYSAPHASHNYCCCCLVAQGCLTLCDPVDCSMPGLPVPHHLPEFAQVHVHCISGAIHPSYPLTPSSPSAQIGRASCRERV